MQTETPRALQSGASSQCNSCGALQVHNRLPPLNCNTLPSLEYNTQQLPPLEYNRLPPQNCSRLPPLEYNTQQLPSQNRKRQPPLGYNTQRPPPPYFPQQVGCCQQLECRNHRPELDIRSAYGQQPNCGCEHSQPRYIPQPEYIQPPSHFQQPDLLPQPGYSQSVLLTQPCVQQPACGQPVNMRNRSPVITQGRAQPSNIVGKLY